MRAYFSFHYCHYSFTEACHGEQYEIVDLMYTDLTNIYRSFNENCNLNWKCRETL